MNRAPSPMSYLLPRSAWGVLALAALSAGCAASAPAPSPAPAASAPRADAQFPTTPPAIGPAPALQLPSPETRTLANGLKVMYVRMPELPVVSAALVTPAGSTHDPANLPGLASFTASMLDEGAGGRDPLQLAEALDLLGARLSTGAGWDAAQVNLYVLRRNLPEALGLMADVAVRPDFPAKEVTRVRDERIVELTRSRDLPAAVAGNAFQALVFGSKHPYGRLSTTQAVRGMDRSRLVQFHRSRYRPDQSTLILVGDVEPASVQPLVEQAFGGWKANGAAPAFDAASLAAPEIARTTVYVVDKPGAAQSVIRIGHPGVARNTPDYFPLMVLNTLLGGSFTSRLNQNLRETHGYTYGAGSSFQMRRGAGPFSAQAEVVSAKTDSAMIEFFRELNRIRSEPIPADELERAKRYLALGFPQDLETTSDVAQQMAGLVTYDLSPGFLAEYVPRVLAVTAEDVRRVANQYIRPDRAVVVVVGDRASIEPTLRALNLGEVQVRPVEEFVKD